MKLLRYVGPGQPPHDGLLHGGRVFPLIGMNTVEALGALHRDDSLWNRVIEQPGLPLDVVTLLPPVEKPGAFMDFYTFEQHVKTARSKRGLEMVPEWYQYPVWYNGSPRCFSGHNSTVVFPPGEPKKDFELELGVVLKKECRGVTEKEAADCIGAYTIVNDFSARALQAEVMKVGLGPAKGKDFNTGLGPWMVTPDEIPDPRNLTMRAWVNGELLTEANSGSSHFTFEQAIAFACEYQTLYPGDVLASGTVGGGCGLELDRFLNSGDVVELEIEHIGRLTHKVG